MDIKRCIVLNIILHMEFLEGKKNDIKGNQVLNLKNIQVQDWQSPTCTVVLDPTKVQP